MEKKRTRKPGGGRKRIHPPGARLLSIRLPPDVLAVIESLGLTIQSGVVQMCRHSPEYQLSGIRTLPEVE